MHWNDKTQWYNKLVDLFNAMSTRYGLFNGKIWFICQFLIVIMIIFSMVRCIFIIELFFICR